MAACRTEIREHPSQFGCFGLIKKNLEEFCFEADIFCKFFEFFRRFQSLLFKGNFRNFFQLNKKLCYANNKDFFSFESYSCPALRIARGIEILRKILTKHEGYSVCSF